jgi:hypothetical protein
LFVCFVSLYFINGERERAYRLFLNEDTLFSNSYKGQQDIKQRQQPRLAIRESEGFHQNSDEDLWGGQEDIRLLKITIPFISIIIILNKNIFHQ